MRNALVLRDFIWCVQLGIEIFRFAAFDFKHCFCRQLFEQGVRAWISEQRIPLLVAFQLFQKVLSEIVLPVFRQSRRARKRLFKQLGHAFSLSHFYALQLFAHALQLRFHRRVEQFVADLHLQAAQHFGINARFEAHLDVEAPLQSRLQIGGLLRR